MPSLSEPKVIGIFVIGLVCAVPPAISDLLLTNRYGIEPESRIAAVVAILGVALYAIYRMWVIYRNVSPDEMIDQKRIDRILAIGIVGFAAILTFQGVVDRLGQSQSARTIGDIISVYVGMRAFTGFMTLIIYITYDRHLVGDDSVRHNTRWMGTLLDNRYANTQVSSLGFLLTSVLAFICAVGAMFLYNSPTQQIVIAYAAFEAIVALGKYGYQHGDSVPTIENPQAKD